ncbi:MAG: ribosome maturation factor RimP [Polyangiaceae bacterium]|nr:ribosome maturation factor RimP [Polyangiaceae bacterium]
MDHATTRTTIDLERVRAALSPVLVAHGVSLVDLEWVTERVGWTLRVTIEREGTKDAGGGVTLEDCANVSRDASSVLDVEDLIPQHYNLEVSSPGLDRKLRTAAEFVRFAGRTAKVKLARPALDGQRVLRGTLEEAPEGRVAVLADGKRVEVALEDIVEARLVFELAPQPRKKPRGGAARSSGSPRKSRSERS